jgi:hypothetical protein
VSLKTNAKPSTATVNIKDNNMIEAIKEFFSELFTYIRHGKIDSIIIATSQDNVGFARTVQGTFQNYGFNCRVVVGEEIALDADTIALERGTIFVITQYSGHAFVRPGITATIANVN